MWFECVFSCVGPAHKWQQLKCEAPSHAVSLSLYQLFPQFTVGMGNRTHTHPIFNLAVNVKNSRLHFAIITAYMLEFSTKLSPTVLVL